METTGSSEILTGSRRSLFLGRLIAWLTPARRRPLPTPRLRFPLPAEWRRADLPVEDRADDRDAASDFLGSLLLASTPDLDPTAR
jgi:hypothetical protein